MSEKPDGKETAIESQRIQRPDEASRDRILRESINCWRIARARRAAFLVDADAYFRAFRSAVREARRSVLIAGWDIDSRVPLLRDGPPDGLPPLLGDFLKEVIRIRKELSVHILAWDYAMVFAFEREWLPIYKLSWGTRKRLHVHMDGKHPIDASHHQKIVVVDDAIGFAGGIDLSRKRWDTPGHSPADPRRADPGGEPFAPRHDVQMAVTGEAAKALGELVRERWRRCTGKRIPPPEDRVQAHPWPLPVAPALENVEVGVARTVPAYDGRPEVREVERLYLDSLAAARRFLYLEHQYLTSKTVGEALAARLRESDGPEVVVVLPERAPGWLEQGTMDVLRARLLAKLKEADRHGRLRVYCPVVRAPHRSAIHVHSKVTIADDEFVRVGSSNLSNRSMGLDTECDLAVEAAGDDRVRRAIDGLRGRLLGEHLGAEPEHLTEAVRREGSWIAAIESLRGGVRTLEELAPSVPEERDSIVPADLVDAERPIDPELVADRLLPKAERKSATGRLVLAAALLALLLSLAAAWRWTPMREWLDIGAIAAHIDRYRGTAVAPFLAAGAFLLGGILVVPVTVLILATMLAFGPWLGLAYSLFGAVLSALLTYFIGRLLGRDTLRRLAGSRVGRVARRLSKRGILTVVAVRMIPVAPYTLINVVAGASRFRLRDFAVGTLIGLAPGMTVIAILVDRVGTAVRNPDASTFLILGGASAGIALAGLAVRSWLRGRRNAGSS